MVAFSEDVANNNRNIDILFQFGQQSWGHSVDIDNKW